MVRHEDITAGTPTPGPSAGHNAPAGPRDEREAAFVWALTAMREDEPASASKIVPAGGLFLAASAAFVVLAALWATIIG